MPNPTQLIPQINTLLKANADPAYLAKIKTLVPSAATIIGVRVPKIRELARSFGQSQALDYETAVALLDALFERQIREEILFGLFLLEKHKRKFSPDLFARIDRWADRIENWEICDQLATRITGEIVAKDLTLVETLVRWSRAENLWRRRLAVATTVALNQKGRAHVAETLQVTDNLMNDPEPMVQKAVAWALREAGQKDERRLCDYLKRWQGQAHPRIIKEGSEKLPPDLRNKLLER